MAKLNKKGYLKIISLHIVVFIFLVNFAFAQLNIAKVEGSPVFQNGRFRVKFDVTIESDDIIAKEEVKIGGEAADSCASQDTGGKKTMLCSRTTQSEFENGGEFSYKITVEHKRAEKIDEGTVIIDLASPELTLECPKESDFNKAELEIPYRVEDKACLANDCPNICSGIKRIEYWINDEAKKTKYDISAANNDCITDSSINNKKIILKREGLQDGKQIVFVWAVDSANPPNAIQKECTIDVDKTPPQIELSSFKLTKQNIEIKAYAPHPVDNVFASINIIGDDLKIETVEADLSKLTGLEEDKNKKASCSKTGNNYKCEWVIALNPESSPEIIITKAEDKNGNSQPSPAKKTLILQKDDKLELESIDALKQEVNGETIYFGTVSGNEITAIFNEQTGLDSNNVFLTTGDKATKCELTNSKWSCTWENLNLRLGELELGISPDTADILGNKISSSSLNKKISVIVDNKKPIVESIMLKGLPAQEALPELQNQVIKNHVLEVKAVVDSKTPVKAEADFSKITIDKIQPIDCEPKDGKWQCSWENIIANEAGPVKRNIKFTFLNIVGKQEEIRAIEVLSLSEEEELWELDGEIACSPEVLSRKIGSFVEITSDCIVSLKPEDNAESLSITLDKGICTTTKPDAASPVKDIKVARNTKGSTEPVLKFTFRKGSDNFKIDEVEYTCTLNIVSRFNDKVIKKPEQETFKVKFKFAELPLGSLEENYQRQITEAKKDIKKRVETINNLKEVLGGAEKACSVFGTILDIEQATYAATGGLKAMACALGSTPAGPPLDTAGAVTCDAEQNSKLVQNTYIKSIGWICSYFVNCEIPLYGKSVVEFFGDWPLMDKVGDKDTKSPRYIGKYLDPKRSLFMSLATGCLPGVVHGIDKLNQVQCTKIHCLQYSLETQRDPTLCEDIEDYQTCKYVVGELFAIIPYAAVWNHLKPLVQETLRNPFALSAFVAEVACRDTCPKKDCAGSFFSCETYRLFTGISKIGGTLARVFNLAQDPNKLFQRPKDADACLTIDFEGIE